MPGGQINDPSSGKHYSLPFLPATPSSPSRTLEGLIELTRHPTRALNLAAYVASELRGYKDTVRCAVLGAEVPDHRQVQLTQTLIVLVLKTHFFSVFQKLGGPGPPLSAPLVWIGRLQGGGAGPARKKGMNHNREKSDLNKCYCSRVLRRRLGR